MKRNLKALGLALVAVFAMSAVAAASAQATAAEFSYGVGTNILKATEDPSAPSQEFSTTAGSFTCDMVEGQATTFNGSEATGEEIGYWDTALGTKAQAKCTGPFGTEPKIETNGCHFKFKAGSTVGTLGEGKSSGTVDIANCSTGEIKINAPLCTIHVTEQENVGPITYKTVTGTPDHVTVEAEATNIVSHHEGFFCGGSAHTDTAGSYFGKATIKAYNNSTQTNATVT